VWSFPCAFHVSIRPTISSDTSSKYSCPGSFGKSGSALLGCRGFPLLHRLEELIDARVLELRRLLLRCLPALHDRDEGAIEILRADPELHRESGDDRRLLLRMPVGERVRRLEQRSDVLLRIPSGCPDLRLVRPDSLLPRSSRPC
jgi:hypothetical protein